MTDENVDQERPADSPGLPRPYGPLGLCVSLVVIFILALVLCTLAVGVGVLMLAAVSGWSGVVTRYRSLIETGLDGETVKRLELAGSILAYAALTAAVVLVARWRAGRSWQGLVAWRSWAIWRSGGRFWLLLGATLLYSATAGIVVGRFYPKSESWFAMPQDRLSLALLLILAVGAAPLAEEMVFRGWIYTSLRSRLRASLAILISSALFAALHYEDTHLYALLVFPVGLALGMVRERSGSVKASMSFHALYNFVVLCLAFFSLG